MVSGRSEIEATQHVRKVELVKRLDFGRTPPELLTSKIVKNLTIFRNRSVWLWLRPQ